MSKQPLSLSTMLLQVAQAFHLACAAKLHLQHVLCYNRKLARVPTMERTAFATKHIM